MLPVDTEIIQRGEKKEKKSEKFCLRYVEFESEIKHPSGSIGEADGNAGLDGGGQRDESHPHTNRWL